MHFHSSKQLLVSAAPYASSYSKYYICFADIKIMRLIFCILSISFTSPFYAVIPHLTAGPKAIIHTKQLQQLIKISSA